MSTPGQGLVANRSQGEIILAGAFPLRFVWVVEILVLVGNDASFKLGATLQLGPAKLDIGSAEAGALVWGFLSLALASWPEPPSPAPLPPNGLPGEADRVFWKGELAKLGLSLQSGRDEDSATVQLGGTTATFAREDFLRWAQSVVLFRERLLPEART